ncbi:MAG: hypothetical protein BWY64_00277 [bacterium ADurb.Bin363]|nr:MAG: hypothetical protein BWY64_00277 [bacterium ADurb.Bin363]
MNNPETLRNTKDYKVVKEYFETDSEGTINCLKERLIAHGELINIYQGELEKIKEGKAKKDILRGGIKETLRSGKMITKWINTLRKDFPEYDFSIYPELMDVVRRMENINP